MLGVGKGQPHYERSGRVLVLLLLAFGVFGLWAGCFTVLLADLSRALGLSPGPLGAALFAGAGASIAAMALLGWSSDHFGRKVFLVVVTCVFACGIVGIALAGSFVALIVAFVVVFPAGGLYDVGINAVAVDLEQLSGRRFMSFLHAAYSCGAVLGAIGAGGLLWGSLDYRLVYLLLLVPLAALIVAFAATRLPRSGGVHGEGPSESVAEGMSRESRWDLYRSAPLLLVAAIAVFGLLAEGEMGHWSGIYLRDSLGVGALLGGSGVAAFYGAMAFGRLATGWAVGRLGNRHTLRWAGLLVTFGMALALATTAPSLVIVGFLVVGLALAAIVPLAFSVSGDLVPHKAASAISVVTTFGYGGFLLGPPLVGGLAEVVGLRVALGLIAVAGLCVFVLSLKLEEKGEGSMPS
jgi:MFS family permease